MTRTKSKAETVKAPAQIASDSDTPASFWPISGSNFSPPTVIDTVGRMSELQVGMSQFASERTRKNAATFAAFLTCRTPLDFLEVWRTAAAEAVSDYAEETARILEIQRT